jgi:hypothetical protein
VLFALHGNLAHVELARDRRELAQLFTGGEGDQFEALSATLVRVCDIASSV